MKNVLKLSLLLGGLGLSNIGLAESESVNFDTRENCVDQCWHDFFPASDAASFQFSLDVEVATWLDDVVFVCTDENEREEKIEIGQHPDLLTTGTVWTSEVYGNPCPGRLKRFAVRGFKMFFNEDDPAIFTINVLD